MCTKKLKVVKLISLILVMMLLSQLIIIPKANAVTTGEQVEIEFSDPVLYKKVLAELDRQEIKYEPVSYIPENPVYKIEIAASELYKVTELDLSSSSENIDGNLYKVGNIDIPEDKRQIVLSNYNDFQAYFKEYTHNIYNTKEEVVETTTRSILNLYDEDFFENNSLAVIYFDVANTNDEVAYLGGIVENNAAVINYKVAAAGVSLPALDGYFIISEVGKNVTSVSGEQGDNIKNDKIGMFLTGLDKFSNLQKLNLANNNVYLVDDLVKLEKLESLNLSGNRVTSLRGLEGFLKRNEPLTTDVLDLRNNRAIDSVAWLDTCPSPFYVFWFNLDQKFLIISNNEEYKTAFGETEYELSGDIVGINKDNTKVLLDTSTVGNHEAIIKVTNGVRAGTTYRLSYGIDEKGFEHKSDYRKELLDDDVIICDIDPNTPFSTFKEKSTDNEITIEGVEDDEIIKTGMQVTKGDTVYTLVVKGDISETGTVDITDLLKLKAHVVRDQELSGISLKAADLTGRGKADLTDLLRLKEMVAEE